MRDYLYLWHEPRTKRLVASGIEFRDIVPELMTTGGIVLLRHQFDAPSLDQASRFDFAPTVRLDHLAADNIYEYGDFCWADFGRDVTLADLNDNAIAELTFFAHATRPLVGVEVPGLGNRFLYWAHDDGWYARIFYSHWDAISPMLRRLLVGVVNEEQATHALEVVGSGEAAVWCHGGVASECERTENIDALLRERKPPPCRKGR